MTILEFLKTLNLSKKKNKNILHQLKSEEKNQEETRNNQIRKELISKLNLDSLELLCLNTSLTLDTLSEYFLNLCIQNPKLLEELNQHYIRNELLQKINQDNYNLSDIHFNDIWIIKYLTFKGNDKKAVYLLKKENDLKNLKYYSISCDNLDELQNLKKEKRKLIPSEFPDIKLEDSIYGIPIEPYLLETQNKIHILNPVLEKNISLEDFSNLFYHGDVQIDDNTIIIIEYEKFLNLIKKDKIFKFLANCQVIFQEEIERVLMLESKILSIFNDEIIKILELDLKKEEQIIKTNHLLYIIEHSHLPLEQKELYTYQIKRNFRTANTKDIFSDYESYHERKVITSKIQTEVELDELKKLTQEFNQLNKELKINKPEKEQLMGTVFIQSIPNFESISRDDLIKKMYELTEEEVNILLDDQLIISKLKSFPSKESKNVSNDDESILDLEDEENVKTSNRRKTNGKKTYNYKFNDDILNFINNFQIPVEEIVTSEEYHIYSPKEINPIISKYKIPKSNQIENVSIANILGYPHSNLDYKSPNILLSMECFFDREGGGYRQRSLGMLEYHNDEIIEKLTPSFSSEPMQVEEIDQNKYCISINGLHRYTILRIHYLLEKYQNKQSLEELEKKYTIPVILNRTDYFKTYSNYLIRHLDGMITSFYVERDNNFQLTGKTEITLQDGKKYLLSDEELKVLIQNKLTNISEQSLSQIHNNYLTYKTFKNFIDTNFEELKKSFENLKGENNVRTHSSR